MTGDTDSFREVIPVCPRCRHFARLDLLTLVWRCPLCAAAVTDQEAKP